MTLRTPRIIEGLPLWQIDALGLGVCAVLAALWYFAGLEPLAQAKAARQSVQATLDERAQEASKLAASKSAQEKSLANMRTALAASGVQLAPADQVNLRVSRLTELARETGLRLDEIKPGAAAPAARFTTVPIHISGGGRYPACAAFLHRLHDEFPDVGVWSMDLRSEPEMAERNARFVLDLAWYAAPAPKRGKK